MRHLIAACALVTVCCIGVAACSGSDHRSAPQPTPSSLLTLGQRADTAGVGGTGHVEFTPDTVVYDDKTSFGSPEHGLFAVVVYQSRNRSKGRVTTTADKGGLRWKAPDGHTVKARNSQAATRLVPIGFSEGGAVFTSQVIHQDVAVFDVAETDKGGTLIYVDGTGTSHRWKIPASNAGTSVPALKFALN